ncbi:MAG TPA: hypothetical protein VNC21_09710 [Vicinamibacterales bacterium]|nr:hypothetical protein [Vicinamibacterales bacterium]
MHRTTLFALAVLVFYAYAAPVGAQQSDPPTVRERLVQNVQEPDQGGGLHVTKHFAIVFGGIKQGSGAAVGPAVSNKFEDGSYLQLKAVYSIRHFKLLQARYDSRSFWEERVRLFARARYQDAPELPVFRLGQESPRLKVDYGERKRELSGRLLARLSPLVRLSSGFGMERYSTTGGRIEKEDELEGRTLPDIPPLPGIDTRPWYAHTFVSAAVDSRPSTDYSRRGGVLEAAVHDYHDQEDGLQSFERFELTAEQLVPMFAGHGVLDVSAQTWVSHTAGAAVVPFFLMPTLGGGDLLRGYGSYRFRDRDALLLQAEYRWAIHKMIDVAGLYEVGKVAPGVKGLSFRHSARSFAAGIRAHSATANLFRADLAHGREGFSFKIGFSTGGS